MANQTITQLPDAGPITGAELVPVVQNGGTYKTTASALAGSPVQTQTFLTKDQELTLVNSRYLSTNVGLGLTDGGATSYYRLSLNGASGSLETASGGIIAKDSASTVVARSLAVSGAGLGVSNADGTGGNPTFQLTGVASAVANLGGTGLMAIVGGSTVAGRQIAGTTNEISVANGNGSGDPTIRLADDAVFPGTGAVRIPVGTTIDQPAGANGQLRYNSDTNTFDGFQNGSWLPFTLGAGVGSFSAGSTGLTPSTATTGSVVLGGTLNVANGGTGANSLTGYVKGAGTSSMTASATVPTSDLSGTVSNAQLANSSTTINGTTIALGASGTITAVASNALTIGTGLSGTSYNGSTPVTVAISNTGVSSGSYGGASKSLSATVNAQGQLTALSESNIAIANTQVSGLGTMSTQNANSVAVTGGTINGTAIGGSTAAAGTFTSVTTSTGTISATPVNATDIVNKSYVDTLAASGIHFHLPVRVESPINLNATYNNGAAGVGATLTNAGTQAALVVDGITLNVSDRVLVYQQTTQTQNGIYVVTDVGSGSTNWVLTRASDADTYVINSAAGLSEGSTTFVQEGATGAGESYTCNTNGTITFGTTNITFAQISSAQIYSAGAGLTLSGTEFSITNTGVTANPYGTASSVPALVINAQGQVTSAVDTPIAIDANQITTGAVTNAQLQNSAVTVNGTSISLGGSGAILAANPNALTIGTGLTGTSYDGSSPTTIALNTSGVVAATYGSASQVPVFAVDAYGRVTSVTDTPIAISSGSVSGLAASATTDTTNAANITSGTLPTGRLSGSYTGISGVGTLAAGTWNASPIGVAYGGTGLTATPSNGQLAIGNGTGYSLATLTAGTNVSISNTAGGITINATPAAGGTVTSVSGSGGTTGLTLSGGPITVSGTLTLGGTLVPANGGTGASTLTGYVYGNGTSTMTASTTIPNTAITGLGTMSTQNATSVNIDGGAIDGTTIGATTASSVRGTTGTFTGISIDNGAVDGGGVTFASSGNTSWEIDNSSGALRFFQPGTTYGSWTPTTFTVNSGLHVGGQIVSSAAKLQVNGFTRTGTVYLHEGDTPSTNSVPLTNVSGDLQWNGSSVLRANNYNSYAPTLTGTGASGTWGINVTGNAATATTATNQSGGTVDATTIVASTSILPAVDNIGIVGSAAATWFNGQFSYLTIDQTLTVRAAIDLADNDILQFGTSDDTKLFYDGVNNTMEMELEAAANSFIITDNGTTRITFTKTGEIQATNNITAYYSDDRLKDRKGDILSALDKVKTLDAFYYEANQTAQDLGYEPVREVGISAQQVQAIMPEVVAPAPIDEKYLTVRYERMVPLLIAAIKELEAQVAELKKG